MDTGLVPEGGYLTVFIPATGRALVFRVRSRANKGYEVLNYGPLPLESGDTLNSYDGGTVSVPADGVMPARSYTPEGLSFSMSGAIEETDMWFLTEEYAERLFHVIADFTPAWLRVDLQIPKGVVQGRFQRDKIMTGVDKDFGFVRGHAEVVHIPKLHYGYRFGNDFNFAVHTGARFTYGEYLVEVPKKPETAFAVVTGVIPSKKVTLPIQVYDSSIRNALLDVYGYEGFPVYPPDMRAEALREYGEIIRGVRR